MSAISGLGWGGLAVLALWDGVGAARWALLASGLICGTGTGLVIYGLSPWVYRRPLVVRLVWAVVSLCIAVDLLGACIGWATTGWPSGPSFGPIMVGALLASPPLWALFGLAALNHEWLRQSLLPSLPRRTCHMN